MIFYNTNNESGEVLEHSEKRSNTQEVVIMDFYNAHKKKYTADQVWTMAFKQKSLLTSVRRGISTLSKEGRLVKKEETTDGFYGKPVHYYSLPSKKENQLDIWN